jgi:hypothetical protein
VASNPFLRTSEMKALILYTCFFHPIMGGGGVNVGTWIFLYPSFFSSNEPRYLLLSLLLTFFDEILLCFEMTMSLEIKIVKNVKGQSRRQ